MDRRELSPTIFETNLFYLFIALALLFIGSYFQNRDIYSGLVVTEYLIILLPTLVYLKVRKYSLKKVLRLNRLSLKQILLIPLITLFAYPVGAFLNYIMIIIISFFGSVKPSPVPIPNTGSEFLLGIIIIAVSAGICEEVMFRGLVMKSYEGLGIKRGIIISGILFGFFHFNIQNLLGPAFLGILFGYIVFKTDSIFAGIIAHTTNNALALTLAFLVSKAGVDPQASAEVIENMPHTLILIVGAVIVGVIAVGSGVIGFFLLKALPRSKNPIIESKLEQGNNQIKGNVGFIPYIPLVFIAVIFTYLSYLFITM